MASINEFIELMKRFRKIEVFGFPKMDIDLTISQLKMIGYVYNKEICRTQDIADGLGLSAPTVSVAVNKLVSKGWLNKESDPDDGRATLISVAGKFIDVFGEVRKKQIEGVKSILSILNEDEKKTLFDLLSRIVNSFE
jgi:DNA-binding MarR family transcriptional regulator